MRIGLAGVGRIGAFHAATLHAVPEIDTLVLADAVPALARDVATALDVECVDSPDGLLMAGIDGLVIAAATPAHAELILAGVEAGLPTFCEKPMALHIEAAVAVVDRVNGSGVPVQIGFQRRFDTGYAAAREAVQSGSLGWIHTIRSATFDPAPPPPEYIAASAGIFRDCNVHDFDSIRWVTGHEVREVYAVGANRGADFFATARDVDAGAAVLTLDDDTLVHVSASRYNAAGYDVRLEVMGSQDSIAAGLDDRVPMRSAEADVTFPTGPPYDGYLDRFRDAYVAELQAFVGVVAGRALPSCTVTDGLEASYVAEACHLSRLEHRPVMVDEVRR